MKLSPKLLAVSAAILPDVAEGADLPDTLTAYGQLAANTTDTNPGLHRVAYAARLGKILPFLDDLTFEAAGMTLDHNTGVALQADLQQGLTLDLNLFSLTPGVEGGVYGLLTDETDPIQGVPYVAGNAALSTNGDPLQLVIGGRLEHDFVDHLETGDGVNYQTSTVPSVAASFIANPTNDLSLGTTVTWYPTDNGPMPALAWGTSLTAKF